jgi:hypothetical protein
VTGPLLASLTDQKLAKAANEAAQHKPITDAGVKKLLAMVTSIGGTAPGSEEKKSYELAQLKSSMVYFGVPVIYLTFNPGENSSPIPLSYAGENIDIKSFTLRCRREIEHDAGQSLNSGGRVFSQNNKHDNTDAVEGGNVWRIASPLWAGRVSRQRTSSYSSRGIYPSRYGLF